MSTGDRDEKNESKVSRGKGPECPSEDPGVNLGTETQSGTLKGRPEVCECRHLFSMRT